MKSNGIEVRPNGCEIHRKYHGPHTFYYVRIMYPSGVQSFSKNGAWTYLRNARKDADSGPVGVNAA